MYISKLTLYCIEALSLKLSRKLGSSRASLKHPNVLHLIFFLVVRIVPTNRLKITSPWNQIFFFYCLRLDFTIYWKTRKAANPFSSRTTPSDFQSFTNNFLCSRPNWKTIMVTLSRFLNQFFAMHSYNPTPDRDIYVCKALSELLCWMSILGWTKFPEIVVEKLFLHWSWKESPEIALEHRIQIMLELKFSALLHINTTDRLHHHQITHLHKINQRPEPYSFKWYNNTLPRVFPMATYSLLAEKSTAVTCPNGVLDVGQLLKEVRLGRWIYVRK